MNGLFEIVDRFQSKKGVRAVAAEIDGSHYEKLRTYSTNLPSLSSRSVLKRRNEFYAGRWCAVQAGLKLSGKLVVPALNPDRSPLWPEGFIGSISHSDHYACALVADNECVRRVGIDLEELEKFNGILDISKQVITSKEHRLIAQRDFKLFLAVAFSAKESLFKALFPEIGEYFDYLDAEIVALENEALTLELVKPLGSVFQKGQKFRLDYRLTPKHVFSWLIEER